MGNEIQIFNSNEFGEVKTIEVNGVPYFNANDVALALGYSNTHKAISTHCKGVTKWDTPTSSGVQKINYITEGDVYRLIIRSKLPGAQRFESWVCDEVLPTIRRTGTYNTPKTYAEALRRLADQAEEAERLALENAELKPKADFFDAVTDSKDAVDMKNVANVLDMGIGRNNLFKFLREQKILMADNRPYQEYIDRGYFRVIEQKFDRGCGEVGISIKTLVFQKGIDFIRKRLLDAENNS